MIKAILVDDHPLMRAGLRQFLESTERVQVAGEAGDGTEAIALVRQIPFDVMLLDIGLPGLSGLDVLRTVSGIQPKMGVLVFSSFAEDQYAAHVLKAGAMGFIAKDAPLNQMLQAIENAARGQHYVSPQLGSQLAMGLVNDVEKPAHLLLSEREFQIFIKLVTGKTPTAIAEELFLSVKTISTHRARILEKMRLKTNADLTYYAIKNHLIQ